MKRVHFMATSAPQPAAWSTPNKPSRRSRGKSILPCLLLLVFFLSSCARSTLPSLQQMASMPQGSICRVAVLPFGTESDYPLADTIVYKVFLAEFSGSGGHAVAQEGDIRKIYQQLRIFPRQQPSLEQLRILASRLDAQLLITGNVIEMRENPGEHRSVNPTITLSLQIYDGRTGGALWSTYHRREGTDYRKILHFGNINTITGLSRRVSREVIELWLQQGLTRCDT